MEVLLLLAAAAGLFALDRKAKAGTPVASPPGGDPSGTYTPPPGSDPSPPPPPAPGQPPTPVTTPPMPPGAYPAGTPGTIPVTVQIAGAFAWGRVTVTPGGVVLSSGPAQTFWFGPGTWVKFFADQNPAQFFLGLPSPFVSFDHFEGSGGGTIQNPFMAQIASSGVVRAVFKTLGL